MIENKWVNGGIAVAMAGALTGLAVWMSSDGPVEQAPLVDQPAQVGDDPAAPPDRPYVPRPPTKDGVADTTEAAPPDMGSLPLPTKD